MEPPVIYVDFLSPPLHIDDPTLHAVFAAHLTPLHTHIHTLSVSLLEPLQWRPPPDSYPLSVSSCRKRIKAVFFFPSRVLSRVIYLCSCLLPAFFSTPSRQWGVCVCPWECAHVFAYVRGIVTLQLFAATHWAKTPKIDALAFQYVHAPRLNGFYLMYA